MDDDVIKAMARWPDVPAVYGWLSLDPRGRWRLHPLGDARDGGPGEAISNPAILAFISRNYGPDEMRRWFFQNGPQRVFVRVDAAPLVLRMSDQEGRLATHTGARVTGITRWLMDESGRLFALTDGGGAMVEDRELEAVLDRLTTNSGQAMIDHVGPWLQWPATVDVPEVDVRYRDVARYDAPLARIGQNDLEHLLGFVAQPEPD